MINKLFNRYKSIDEGDNHLPFFRQPSTWIAVLVGVFVILLLSGAFRAGSWLSFAMRTEVVSYECKNQFVKETTTVDIWSTDRKYNRSSVPECAWDTSRHPYYTCTSRDENGTCTGGYWDTDYDYSIRDWVKFKVFENNHQHFNDDHLRPYIDTQYRVQTTLKYLGMFVSENGQEYWLEGPRQFVVGQSYQIVQGVRHQRIRKLK